MAITVVITVAMTTTAATVTTITTITTAWACCKSSTLTDALRLLVRGRRRRRRLAKNGELAARPCHLIANFILMFFCIIVLSQQPLIFSLKLAYILLILLHNVYDSLIESLGFTF